MWRYDPRLCLWTVVVCGAQVIRHPVVLKALRRWTGRVNSLELLRCWASSCFLEEVDASFHLGISGFWKQLYVVKLLWGWIGATLSVETIRS